MDRHALVRFSLLGEIFIAVGTASTRIGNFMANPDNDVARGCLLDVANLLGQAASLCDAMAAENRHQADLGLASGYLPRDSAMLAQFEILFRSFSGVVHHIGGIRFTDSNERKADLWQETAQSLREAVKATLRQYTDESLRPVPAATPPL